MFGKKSTTSVMQYTAQIIVNEIRKDDTARGYQNVQAIAKATGKVTRDSLENTSAAERLNSWRNIKAND